ncbi:MAG: hypothetical protein FWF29_05210, partial [Treponema sp.]|nr:hypothetical protein [Treponema sp.]
ARVAINDIGFFEKITRSENIPDTILGWSKKQLEYIRNFEFSRDTNKPVFGDGNVTFSKAERARKENRLGTGTIELYGDKLKVCGQEFGIGGITTAVHGVRKMTIYGRDGVYAVFAPSRVNLVKYMICGYHLRNKIMNQKEEYYGY